MNFRNASRVVGALATVLLLQGVASAASMVGTGQFNLSGSVYITNTSFLFGYSAVPTATSADQTASVILPTTGAFSDLTAGELSTMNNLLTPGNGAPFGPGPVVPGSSFVLSPFLQLPDGIDADLTGLPVNMGVAVCSGTSFDSVGSICRAEATSPVVLEQGTSGVTAILSLQGRAYYAGSTTYTPLAGKFSADFAAAPDQTISGLLADFNTNGHIQTGFEANFSTTSTTPVPEPASMALLGASLFGLGLLGKKKLVK